MLNSGAERLRILHISDLHERAAFSGMPPKRQAVLDWDARERGYVLGAHFLDALQQLRDPGVHVVCFTGDLADWGHPAEYQAATKRIEQILQAVNVPRERFFAVPGNHDVQRTVHDEVRLRLRAWFADSHDAQRLGRWYSQVQDAPPGLEAKGREQLLERTAAFWDWLAAFRGDGLRPQGSQLLGYRRSLSPGALPGISTQVHIVGLDSAWMCGADDDQGHILVTEAQVDAHVRDGANPLDGLRIGLIHHPIDHLADHHEVRRALANDGVDLLLHGHQHTPAAIVSHEPGAYLRVLAAGCLIEGDLGKGWPNGFQLIEVDPSSLDATIHFRKWVARPRSWFKGSDIYSDARDGVLAWPKHPPVRPDPH